MKTRQSLSVWMMMVAMVLLLVAGCGQKDTPVVAEAVATPEKVFKWRAQGIYTPGDPGLEIQQSFVNRVRELSGGRIDITLHPIGAIVGPFETFDNVATGVLEVGMKTPMWWPGKEPAMNLFTSLPGSFSHAYQLDAWYWEHGGIELAREAYAKHNLFFVGPAIFGVPPIGAEIVHSRRPIHSIDDYKGIKIRSGGAAAKWFEGLGASIVSLPGPEIYAALEKGVVDAAEWVSPNSNYALGLHEAAPYVITPGLHTSLMASEVIVSLDEWNALPDDLKAIMEVAVKELSIRKAQRFEKLDHYYLKKMKEHGVEVIEWSPEEIARAVQYSMTLWESFATDDLSRRVLASQVAYLKMAGIID